MRRLLLLFVALALLAGCGTGDGPSADGPRPFETVRPGGDHLPDAELELLGQDGVVDTAEWRGRPTVVNFWATWCPPCVDEMPAFESAHQRLGDDVRFVGVDVEDPNEAAALELAHETGVSYLLVRDPDRRYFQEVKGRGMPFTVLVDGDGVIRYRHNGPLTEQQLLDLVDEHLDL